MDLKKLKKDELVALVEKLASKVNQQSEMIERFKDYDLERSNQMKQLMLNESNALIEAERFKTAYIKCLDERVLKSDKNYIIDQTRNKVKQEYEAKLYNKRKLIDDLHKQINTLQGTCKKYQYEISILEARWYGYED